jgi:hypothetical protein
MAINSRGRRLGFFELKGFSTMRGRHAALLGALLFAGFGCGDAPDAKRQADVYVFALLAHEDRTTIDPLDLDQWKF